MTSTKYNNSEIISNVNYLEHTKEMNKKGKCAQHNSNIQLTSSLNNLYISEERQNTELLKNNMLLNLKRHSKSEMQLNITDELEVYLRKENIDFLEKTEDLLTKALKIALEDKQQILKKTDLDTDKNKYINENNKDYLSETIEDSSLIENNTMMMSSPQTGGINTDSDGLILPKKLINPCLESTDRRDLHRELRFNQKVGRNVLNQKSELQKAMEKQKERQILAQQQQNLRDDTEAGLKNELNRVIMERAQKNEKKNSSNQDHDQLDSHVNPEYLNARAKLRTRIDMK